MERIIRNEIPLKKIKSVMQINLKNGIDKLVFGMKQNDVTFTLQYVTVLLRLPALSGCLHVELSPDNSAEAAICVN